MSKETRSPVLDPQELKSAYSGSAILSNKFYVTVGPVVRITFSEGHSSEAMPVFRTAVALSIQDAIALKNVLQDLLKEPEEAVTKAISKAQQKKEVSNG